MASIIEGICLSTDLFDTTAKRVFFHDEDLGKIKPEGKKFIAEPTNGKPLPVDTEDQGILVLINVRNKSLSKPVKKTCQFSMF
jgi:hypothetical protein